MAFEPFAPIDLPGDKRKEDAKNNDEREQLRRQIEELRRENLRLKQELERVKFAYNSEKARWEEERNRLLQQLELLSRENNELKLMVQNLQRELQLSQNRLEELQHFLKNLSEEVQKALKSQKEELLNTLLSVVVESLKELLRTEKLHNEETLKRVFSEIFSEKLFTGEITLKVNPQDAPLVEELLRGNPKAVFDIVPDPSLKRGELEVETEQFFIERKYDTLVEEIVSHLLRELVNSSPQGGGEKEGTAKGEETGGPPSGGDRKSTPQ